MKMGMSLHAMVKEEGVTHSAGVPTVWLSMFADMDQNGGDYGDLKVVVIGGSAAPRAMVERLMKNDIRVAHAWGMTETSPIGTTGNITERVDRSITSGCVSVMACITSRRSKRLVYTGATAP